MALNVSGIWSKAGASLAGVWGKVGAAAGSTPVVSSLSFLYKHRRAIGVTTFIGSSLWSAEKIRRKTMIFPGIDSAMKPGGRGIGPGYISWTKRSGLPGNHLSTDGLSLALSSNRHTSII